MIENEYLFVDIKKQGGEVTRIYNKLTKKEILWNGNPKYWKRHSPILFPNVGKNVDNKYQYNGKEYITSQHGFARDSEFSLINIKSNQATFELCSNEDTKKNYPFDFTLQLKYVLDENRLQVYWNVKNIGRELMLFTIGGHPAFRFENEGETKKDYILNFPKRDNLKYLLIKEGTGTVDPYVTYNLELYSHTCELSEEMFEKDALIFDDGQIQEVIMCHKDGRPYVGINSKDFPNFGIWSVKDAPFICLEPWVGRCDNYDFKGDISEKSGIIGLKPDDTFDKMYEIVVY